VKRVLLTVLAATATAAVLPATAGASTQIGQTISPAGSACSQNVSWFQGVSPNNQFVVPVDGVITSWSFIGGVTPPSSMKLKVAKLGVTTLSVVAESGSEHPAANVLNTFSSHVTVHAGEVIGFYFPSPNNIQCAATGQAGYNDSVLLWLHPARGEVLHPAAEPSRPLAAFVVVAAVPLLWFGLAAASLQRNGPASDPHVSMSHWTTMASMAFALVLVGLLASLRIRGWRFTAWCAGVGAAVYGLASIVFAHFPISGVRYAGSQGIGWGIVALLGGVAFVGLAERERRSSVDRVAIDRTRMRYRRQRRARKTS
jgi:hypothetical protein